MSVEMVNFISDGLKLSGALSLPTTAPAGGKHAAIMVLHGFGSNKSSKTVTQPCEFLNKLGYATLSFDMRGCGDSEGERARIICLEQVEDTRNALTFLQGHPAIDAKRIACMGTSFGAAVTVYAAGVDDRIAAAISVGGWGDGEKKFRAQHPTPEAWAKFTNMLAEGKRHREKTGKPLMVPRYDIVPIPPHLRGHVAPGSILEFPHDTAQSMFDFRANEVVGRISPRPLLLMHPAVDSVTPTQQSIDLFGLAGQPTEMHLFSDADHFLLAEDSKRELRVLSDWLERYFPV
jgi:dipeptidyl aminopeptidase/acylaminoacyl peptidase